MNTAHKRESNSSSSIPSVYTDCHLLKSNSKKSDDNGYKNFDRAFTDDGDVDATDEIVSEEEHEDKNSKRDNSWLVKHRDFKLHCYYREKKGRYWCLVGLDVSKGMKGCYMGDYLAKMVWTNPELFSIVEQKKDEVLVLT